MPPPISKAAENSFNAVRLLAALQVAYVHAVAHLHLEPGWGWDWIIQFPGVPVFFAVSGYLVFDSLLRLPLPEFAVHRMARIYPALIVSIAAAEFFFAIAGQTDISKWTVGQLAEFFASFGLTASDGLAYLASGVDHSIHTFNGFFKTYPPIEVLWTLTVELTFYLAVPFFAVGRSRIFQTLLVAAASLASFAYQKHLGAGITTYDNWPISVSVFPYFWMFGIGMLFRLWRPSNSAAWIAIPTLVGAFVAIAWSRGLIWFEWKVEPSLSASIETALLCLLALWIGYSPLMKSRWLAQNDMSYGVYLYHMLVVVALMNAAPSRWLILVVLGGAMAAGLLSWHLVERPCMRAARKGYASVTPFHAPL